MVVEENSDMERLLSQHAKEINVESVAVEQRDLTQDDRFKLSSSLGSQDFLDKIQREDGKNKGITWLSPSPNLSSP